MTIARVRVALTGAGIVGPGLMTFYTRNITPGSLPGAIKAFLTACQPALAGGVVMDVPNQGDTINETNGELVGGWTGTGGGQVIAPATGTYTLGAGGRIEWVTQGVFAGHHPRGRTFLVPLISGAYDSTGRLASNIQSQFQTAANNLITAGGGDLVVWARPRLAGSGKLHNLPARDGGIVPITSATVPATPTSLRSRRH